MEENHEKSVVNHYEAGSNCQVFNGDITGCVFAMPGATVTQQPVMTAPHKRPPQELPEQYEALTTSAPWQRAQEAGLIGADGQPTVSRPEAALLANVLAAKLHIANKWKFFEALWLRNNMRGDYNTALNQMKSLEFQERLKNILG
jgi:hypothetical protein